MAAVEVPETEAPEAFSASSIPDPTPTGSWHLREASHSIVDEALDSIAPTGVAGLSHLEPELETTAAEKVEAHVEKLAELETAAEGPVEVEPTVDPALVTDPEEMMKFTIKVGTENGVAEEAAAIGDSSFAEATHDLETAPSVGDDTAEFVAEAHAPHTFHDDPMVQMGAISIDESPAPMPEPEPVAQVGDDTMKLSLHSSFGLEGALHEFEAATEESAQAAVEEPASFAPEGAVVETPSWEPVVAAEVTPAPEATWSPEPTAEPEHVPEAFSSFVPESTYPTSVVAEMAAVSPELEHEPEVIVVPEPSHGSAPVAAVIDSVVEEKQEETKTLAAAAGMDASTVARAVQKVFERYREQMVADITDELSKGE
jgi:hypothetical protein